MEISGVINSQSKLYIVFIAALIIIKYGQTQQLGTVFNFKML